MLLTRTLSHTILRSSPFRWLLSGVALGVGGVRGVERLRGWGVGVVGVTNKDICELLLALGVNAKPHPEENSLTVLRGSDFVIASGLDARVIRGSDDPATGLATELSRNPWLIGDIVAEFYAHHKPTIETYPVPAKVHPSLFTRGKLDLTYFAWNGARNIIITSRSGAASSIDLATKLANTPGPSLRSPSATILGSLGQTNYTGANIAVIFLMMLPMGGSAGKKDASADLIKTILLSFLDVAEDDFSMRTPLTPYGDEGSSSAPASKLAPVIYNASSVREKRYGWQIPPNHPGETPIKMVDKLSESPLIFTHSGGENLITFIPLQEQFTSALWGVQAAPETPLEFAELITSLPDLTRKLSEVPSKDVIGIGIRLMNRMSEVDTNKGAKTIWDAHNGLPARAHIKLQHRAFSGISLGALDLFFKLAGKDEKILRDPASLEPGAPQTEWCAFLFPGW
ncbi:hypothetical protein F5051DRAFT_431461 [Lentinula edodes]|nr:hypothetical protein F5051DRAFT_431461 [Lentinula edodes]